MGVGRHLASIPTSPGRVASPKGPPLLLPQPHTSSPPGSPLGLVAQPRLRGAGPGALYTVCPQVAYWDNDGKHPPRRDHLAPLAPLGFLP